MNDKIKAGKGLMKLITEFDDEKPWFTAIDYDSVPVKPVLICSRRMYEAFS